MGKNYFYLLLVLPALIAATGWSDGPRPTAVRSGEASIPLEIRTYEPPLRLEHLELQGGGEEPGWLEVELIPDDDSGIVWDIKLRKAGEQASGEVLFRLASEAGTAETTLVVEK